jgi:hypothetical protein
MPNRGGADKGVLALDYDGTLAPSMCRDQPSMHTNKGRHEQVIVARLLADSDDGGAFTKGTRARILPSRC